MTVPLKFRKTPENALTTYNFNDILQGRGILQLYAVKTADNKILSNYPLYPCRNGTDPGNYTETTNPTALDLDWDALVSGNSLLVEGKVSVEVPLILANTSGNAAVSTVITVTLRKVSGGVETDLGTANVTVTSASLGAGTSAGFNTSLDFNVTRTKFKLGDTIRLTTEMTAPDTSRVYTLVHDARGQAVTGSVGSPGTFNSILSCYIPVVIDI